MSSEWPSREQVRLVKNLKSILKQVSDELAQADLALHMLADNEGIAPARNVGWAELAEHYRKAANDVRDVGLIVEFDKSPYSFTLEEFLDCRTRPIILEKVRGLLEALNTEKLVGADMLAILKEKEIEAHDTYTVLIQLIDFCAHLPTEREYVLTYFSSFVWTDLELVVRPELSDYWNLIKNNIVALEREIAKVELESSNLAFAKQQIEQMNCSIEGTFNGLFITPNRSASIKIIRVDASYSGTLTVSGGIGSPTRPITNITVGSAGEIEFLFPHLQLRWKGNLSSNFKRMSGQVLDAAGVVKGTFDYTKI